jgi:DNA repair photolyase
VSNSHQDPPHARGRGAQENPGNRFERLHYEPDPEATGERSRVETRFYIDHTQKILSTNDSPDIPFRYSINPYRGCEHGCIYCYARPTHEYLGFSAGLDFESRIMVKTEAPRLLREELMSPRWIPEEIAISGVTDCYQPCERKFQLTRKCLEVLAEFRNPVGVITKNHLVTRDIDLLQDLAAHDAARVYVSITTLDESLARTMEPRTSSPSMRLDAIRKLSDAGIPAGVMTAPVIPGLNDHEIPAILQAASEAGARYAGYVVLRLPWGVKDLFTDWLERERPGEKEKVLSRLRSMRSGKLNSAEFRDRMRGEGIFAEQVRALFQAGARRAGLDKGGPELSTAHFRRPGPRQMELFG